MDTSFQIIKKWSVKQCSQNYLFSVKHCCLMCVMLWFQSVKEMWVKCCEEMENVCGIEAGYGPDLMCKFKTTGQESEGKMLVTQIIRSKVQEYSEVSALLFQICTTFYYTVLDICTIIWGSIHHRTVQILHYISAVFRKLLTVFYDATLISKGVVCFIVLEISHLCIKANIIHFI